MNHLNFEYVPVTFIKNDEEIKKQIQNTLILIHLFEKYNQPVRLEKLIEGTQYGYNAAALKAGKNKFLRISDIYESKVNWATVPFCNCKDEETYLLKKDDILVARTGGSTGKSFKIDNPPEHAIYAGYLIRIRAKVEVNPDYIYLFLHSFGYWSQIVNLNEKNFRPRANAENLKALILPNCPKSIQDEMVEISRGKKIIGYEDLFSKIEKTLSEYEKKKEIENLLFEQITQLENLNQAVLQEAVQGKLVRQNPKDEPALKLLKRIQAENATSNKKQKLLLSVKSGEIPFDIPRSWEWSRLGECSDISSGIALGKRYSGQTQKFPYLRVANVQRGRITTETMKYLQLPEEVASKYLLIANDILVNEGGDFDKVGRCSIWDGSIAPCLHQNHLFRIRSSKHIDPKYLEHAINSEASQKYFLKYYKKSTNLASLNKTNLSNLLIALPPLSEQKRIVAEIEKQMLVVKKIKDQILANQHTSEQLLKALLHKAFEANHTPQPQILKTKSITVSKDAFWQYQLIATYIKILQGQNSDMLQGEMGLVKYSYLDVVINKTKAPFTFRPWIFGPYTEEIKEILHSNTDVFTHKKVGNKGFEVYDLGKAADSFIDRENQELNNVATGFQRIVDVFKPFSKKERTRQLELVACVCWLIEKLQTLNITSIYQGMKGWVTPKREEGKNKAEIFTKLETVAAIYLIKQHQWHKKLLK